MIKALLALIVSVVFITACGHRHGEEGNVSTADQTDHIDKETYTLYSDWLELFVEFDPIVVGETSTFYTHLTNLNGDYSPLIGAEVNLQLIIDQEVTQHFESKVIRDGIYQFDVSPQFAGEGELIFNIETPDFTDRFILGHVHIFPQSSDIHAHGPEAVSDQVTFTKEQAWVADFNVEQIGLRDFSKVINTSGEILAMPGEKQNLTAKNDGIVLFSTRNMVQGSPVKKGYLIFTISGKGFTEDNISVEFQQAFLNFEKSKNQYQRHKKLVDEKIVSQSQFFESKSQYLVDSVHYFNLKKNVSDGGLKVYAPLSGYIHELNVSEGQFASKGSILATVSNNKVLLLRADVPQQYYRALSQISDATFRPAYSEKVYTITELNGKLLAKASSVAENNHYMPVYFEVINDGTLLEGAFAEFHLKGEPQSDILLVPVEALIEEQNSFYVYVQLSGEHYVKRQVSVGDNDGLFAEIQSGLSDRDRVVTNGAVLLKASSVSSSPVHSHTH